MVRNKKNTLSVFLVVVFLLPTTIKLFDGFFHHHDYFICTAKNERHFHTHHVKCPILSFELSLLLTGKHLQVAQKNLYHVKINDNYNFECCSNNIEYSFLLRAPPVLQVRDVIS
jgi:hypothetical protein